MARFPAIPVLDPLRRDKPESVARLAARSSSRSGERLGPRSSILLDRVSMQRRLESIAKKPIGKLDERVQRYFGKIMSQHADEMTLLRSPLFRVESSVGAFVELVDPRIEAKTIKDMRSDLFYADDALDVALLHRARIPARAFDAGNTLVTDRIREIRDRVTATLEIRHELVTPANIGAVDEASSKLVKGVGASDLASGYARELYSNFCSRPSLIAAILAQLRARLLSRVGEARNQAHARIGVPHRTEHVSSII